MRDIPGYEGLYAATSCGRVWSYRRKKFLKPGNDGRGYKIVSLSKNGERKTYKIHRLVVETYLPNPDNLPQVNHKDENKANNALQNLEYCDAAYNTNYGTGKERSAKARSKKIQCIETQEVFDSIKDAAKAINRSTGNICDCLAGRNKTTAGYHWKYYDQKEED